jgi:transcriptional regulator GlxA family with amidase domain
MNQDAKTLRVGIVAPNGSQALDVIGPVDAFTQVNRLPESRTQYEVVLIGMPGELITAASGIRMVPDYRIGDAIPAIDTLLVAGSPDFEDAMREGTLHHFLRQMALQTRRLGSVCNGAFILGAAGLLKDRRVTTHWQFASALAKMFPETRVEPDQIFVRDGPIYSSAGVTAGIDLALYLIEQDCGASVSLAVARALVVFLRRPGGQSQFSEHLKAQSVGNAGMRDVVAFAITHLDEDLSLARLARLAGMSERNFTRTFQQELLTTPARFVERARVEAARGLLESERSNLEQIAFQCGFGSADTMRRTFHRYLRVTPAEYRQRFRIGEPSFPLPAVHAGIGMAAQSA